MPCIVMHHWPSLIRIMHYHKPLLIQTMHYRALPGLTIHYHAPPCVVKRLLDHGITPMIPHRCAQALCAPCQQSISTVCTILSVVLLGFAALPFDPTFDPVCAFLPLGSSHGCKDTHEALFMAMLDLGHEGSYSSVLND